METLEAIRTRRSIRKYLDKPLLWLAVAMLAPTYATAVDQTNLKPIRIVLVGDSTVASYANPPKDKPDLTGWGQVSTMDAFLERLCSVFNFFEALFWIAIATGFGVTYWRKRHNGDLMLAAGLLLFEFGLSDFVEMQTGAWYRPWWLCVWKIATVIALLVLFGLFRRRRSVSTPAVCGGAPAQPSRLIRWITLLWRGGCAAVVASACVLLFVPVARIGPESCDRIRPGITVAQAEQVVGAPTGWYDHGL